MKGNISVAAQLYTIRNFLKTPEEIKTALKNVKKIGYDAVQVSGMGAISPEGLKEIADGIGLKICATHIPFERLKNDIDVVIAEHKLWGCEYVGLGAMPLVYRGSRDGYMTFAAETMEIAKKLAEHGLKFIYHNHNFEFFKFDGITGLDILYNETNPEIYGFELDTYWVQAGGADPVQWIKRMKDRMDVVHFKDMALDTGFKQIFAEIGNGNLNWPGILDACIEAGAKWYVVEQDECAGNPFMSLEISLNNMMEW
jgi:Sugar phosphate isomerases/epimerases